MGRNKGVIKEIISWVIVLVAAFFIGHCLNRYVLLKADVPSGSMENTIMKGDRLMGFRLAYLFSEPERGDIVMFDFPDDEDLLYVKRIIGLPGETVEIEEGAVYITDTKGNRTLLDEPYLKETPNKESGVYEVPEGHYFMMGDNRNVSADSRRWENKFVAKEKIRCKVWFRYKPDFEFIK